MIPSEIYRSINAGTSNEELRSIADAENIEYSELWAIRQKKKQYFEYGVNAAIRRSRWR